MISVVPVMPYFVKSNFAIILPLSNDGTLPAPVSLAASQTIRARSACRSRFSGPRVQVLVSSAVLQVLLWQRALSLHFTSSITNDVSIKFVKFQSI